MGMKHWGAGLSPHLMRTSALSMALPFTHASARMEAHSHIQSTPHLLLLVIPAGTLGKSTPSHTHLSAPTPPRPPPPVAADVPRSVAYHLLPHSTPTPHLLLLSPSEPPPDKYGTFLALTQGSIKQRVLFCFFFLG